MYVSNIILGDSFDDTKIGGILGSLAGIAQKQQDQVNQRIEERKERHKNADDSCLCLGKGHPLGCCCSCARKTEIDITRSQWLNFCLCGNFAMYTLGSKSKKSTRGCCSILYPIWLIAMIILFIIEFIFKIIMFIIGIIIAIIVIFLLFIFFMVFGCCLLIILCIYLAVK